MTTFQLDIFVASAVAGVIVMAFGLFVRARASADNPGTGQILWEWTVRTVDTLTTATPARFRKRATALAVTLFWFILAANWLPLLPGSPLPAPTSNVNLTLALGIVVIAVVHVTAVQVRGLRGYLR